MRQELQLGGALDTLGDDLQTQAMTEGNDGTDDRCRTWIGVDTLDEHAVEFDPGDRQLFERGERRIADAEIIECDRHPHLPQTTQRFDGVGSGLEDGLRQLELQRARRQACDLERMRDVVDKIALEELRWGHVDGHTGAVPTLRAPSGDR